MCMCVRCGCEGAVCALPLLLLCRAASAVTDLGGGDVSRYSRSTSSASAVLICVCLVAVLVLGMLAVLLSPASLCWDAATSTLCQRAASVVAN